MKKILLISVSILLFGCMRKTVEEGQLNLQDNTRYHSSILKLMDSATVLSSQNETKDAVLMAKKAIERQQFLIAFRDNVKTYEEQKQYPLAIKKTLEAIAKIPDFADAYYKLGILYSKAGEESKSAEAFEKAKQLYELQIKEKDTDRNRLLTCANLIKIDIYRDSPQTAQLTRQRLAKDLYNGNEQMLGELNNTNKADLLSKVELAVN